jgi:diaminobutyrate-2-oxoglutarate transaminase
MDAIVRHESAVRSYSRTFPATFATGSGPFLYDTAGRRYIDFLCCAGALGYGHNDPRMKQAVIDYLLADGVSSVLDLATVAKERFLERFHSIILAPRQLDYRVQFTGPTGANAVESALKLARKATGRSTVVAFTNSYHGLSAGALAVTADSYYRNPAFFTRADVAFFPFANYFGPQVDTLDYLEKFVEDTTSGLDPVAAVIVETVQAEGGVNVAPIAWLRRLEALCRRHGMLLIVDDIQVGSGRTGTFFSFEPAGIRPDIVLLSKAIGGFGLPLSISLQRPEIDCWQPGEHTGTFRGNNVALVAATEALSYWEDGELPESIAAKGAEFRKQLEETAALVENGSVRGRGLICGLELGDADLAARTVQESFRRGLIAERCGPRKSVIKFLPPMTCDASVLREAADIVSESVRTTAAAGTGIPCA